jgi:hypothetical protein
MHYEIRIKGYLDDDIAIWFNAFKIEYTPDGNTVLRGTVIDQTELHGILMRIRDLGLVLLMVQQTEGDQ